MKKALSVFLAVLMIFAALSVGASAEGPSSTNPSPYHGDGKPCSIDQVALSFDPNGGKFKNPVAVYSMTDNVFTIESDYSSKWIMLPAQNGDDTMRPGRYVNLPTVTAPDGYQFDGWYCYKDHATYGVREYKIPDDAAGTTIEFAAAYSPAVVEEPTMTKVMGILMKVFGAIVGLLFFAGDSSAGMDMMEKILGGIF